MLWGTVLAALLLPGCSQEQSGPVVVSVIGSRRDLDEPMRNILSPAAKLIMESTAQGLVAFDAAGDIMPALAERWIVEDGGLSYIFRIRRARWSTDVDVTAKEVARLLDARIRANVALDPHGDLNAVEEIVPMTGEVIEIRLSAPRPYLLQMLAQPQMGIIRSGDGTGPYRAEDRDKALFLTPVPDPDDGDGADTPVAPRDDRVLRAEHAAHAIARFQLGLSGLVLGGRYSDMPLLTGADIDNNAVRMDPAQGLFGLSITGHNAFLGDAAIRAALSMAVERERIPSVLSLGRWTFTDRLLPQQFDLPAPAAPPIWDGQSIDDRRAAAAAAVAKWTAANGAAPVLRVAMPAGSGTRRLFATITADWQRIGVRARLVPLNAAADLMLVDEVAAYDSAIWYLDRISCARGIHCDDSAEALLESAALATDANQRAATLAEAARRIIDHGGYIPLGAPIRWSLVSRTLNGFTPSPRARHPLNQLFRATN
ncbi:ABC transporter substrate-binding protein [Sphingobium aquiterrae]|uniref:ABC transporter substrate-binding protein n=1 Tax=Sphingobium aquiterrae TaxID=2038656 RepID=UPI00301A07F2